LALVPLLCGLALLGASGRSPAPAAGGCEAKKKAKKAKKGTKRTDDCSGMVCAIFPYADYGSYCSFYAKVCDTGEYVNLDADCAMPYGPPCIDSSTCVPVGSDSEEDNARASHTHSKKVHGGLEAKKGVKTNPIHAKGKAYTTLISGPLLAYIQTSKTQTPKDYPKVALYQMLVTPPNVGKVAVPPRIFATGLEVDTEEEPTVTIPQSDIIAVPGAGKVCIVQLGSVTYQLVMWKNTTVDVVKKKK
jgi:hypothetical protein